MSELRQEKALQTQKQRTVLELITVITLPTLAKIIRANLFKKTLQRCFY